jgi:hypothetical protein
LTLTTPDRDVPATSAAAYLDFSRVLPPGLRPPSLLRTGPAYRPSTRISRLARGAVGISAQSAEQNPPVSIRVRARKIRHDFSGQGAVGIAGTHRHVNPGCSLRVRARRFRLGGRYRGENFLRLHVNRVRCSPRACRGFCRGFSAAPEGRSQSRADRRRETTVATRTHGRNHKPLGAMAVSTPCPEQDPTVSLRTRVAENGYRRLAPTDRVGSAADRRLSRGLHGPFSRISGRILKNRLAICPTIGNGNPHLWGQRRKRPCLSG